MCIYIHQGMLYIGMFVYHIGLGNGNSNRIDASSNLTTATLLLLLGP